MTIDCYDVDSDQDFIFKIKNLAAPEPELSRVWPKKQTECEVSRTAGDMSDVEKKALAASHYSRKDLKYLYEFCAENDPDDSYAKLTASEEQIPELRGWLLMCPHHPNAKGWRAALVRGEQEQKVRKAGRIFDAGTFRVGKDIKPGTYEIAGDIEDCYWERQDRSGRPIDNAFIDHARRVQVTIRSTDYAFSSEGCGTWRPS